MLKGKKEKRKKKKKEVGIILKVCFKFLKLSSFESELECIIPVDKFRQNLIGWNFDWAKTFCVRANKFMARTNT